MKYVLEVWPSCCDVCNVFRDMLFVFSRSRLSWQQSHESTQALLVESKTASFCELPQLLSVDKSKGGRGGRTRYLYSFSSSIIDSSQLRTRVLSANK